MFVYFYPRSPCGERRVHYDNYNLHCVISIHALLAESDRALRQLQLALRHFYPRSPCGERQYVYVWYTILVNFYPRSPCGERPGCQRLCGRPTRDFYPRSPCGERLINNVIDGINKIFLSTLSLRRATKLLTKRFCNALISIHALLAESDKLNINRPTKTIIFLSTLSLRRATSASCSCRNARPDFYPRSPCGERPKTIMNNIILMPGFLSTLSLRRATSQALQVPRAQ